MPEVKRVKQGEIVYHCPECEEKYGVSVEQEQRIPGSASQNRRLDEFFAVHEKCFVPCWETEEWINEHGAGLRDFINGKEDPTGDIIEEAKRIFNPVSVDTRPYKEGASD